ncbi:alpha/beta fold hydrolase [Mucilaginibacter pedocola]|uniref:Alpha/beta hydrolase n=1 Tax=Mucilaginibacter pedocola TaxID=1792845 RepID=A0A1S9P8P0_9SPHI|nr:alpha/beta hydrolase [Mucilaginibacter pedocola]OOQ57289.1 alpha/beta hydrolase [Mucilaginibacter pedocola]
MKALILSATLAISLNVSGQTKPLPPRHFMQVTTPSAGGIPYGNNPAAGKYANAGDAKIYYEVYGKGEPFVVLHGGVYGSMQEMGRFIDSLATRYRVIAVGTRGHGKSEIGRLPVTAELKANDIIAVINAETRDSVNILGFSDGAYTGYIVAGMYPQRVKKLIAVGAGEQTPGLRKVILDTKTAFKADSAYWKQQLALMPQPGRLQVYWDNLADFYNSMEISKKQFAIIKCPVLVMAGERDQNAPLATIIAAYQMIPNSQLSIIPNAPHPVFLVNFPAVWDSIVPFLNK